MAFRLRKEQRRIARTFFQKLRKDFEIECLETSDYSYNYKGWEFKREYHDFWHPTIKEISYSRDAQIRGGFFFNMRVNHFLSKQNRNKQAIKKRESLKRELEPTILAIGNTFEIPATEIYESLNNNYND